MNKFFFVQVWIMPDIRRNLCDESCARWWTNERWIMRDRRKVRSDKMRWWDRIQMLLSITISTITQTTCQCQWLCSSNSNSNKWQPTQWWIHRTWAISIYRQPVSMNFIESIFVHIYFCLRHTQHIVMFLLECALMSFVITVLCTKKNQSFWTYTQPNPPSPVSTQLIWQAISCWAANLFIYQYFFCI